MCACFTLPERNGVFAEVSCSDDVALLYRPLKQCNSIVIALDLRPAALQPRSPAASQSRRSRPRSCAVGWRKGGPYRSAAPPLRPHTHTYILSLSPCFSLCRARSHSSSHVTHTIGPTIFQRRCCCCCCCCELIWSSSTSDLYWSVDQKLQNWSVAAEASNLLFFFLWKLEILFAFSWFVFNCICCPEWWNLCVLQLWSESECSSAAETPWLATPPLKKKKAHFVPERRRSLDLRLRAPDAAALAFMSFVTL